MTYFSIFNGGKEDNEENKNVKPALPKSNVTSVKAKSLKRKTRECFKTKAKAKYCGETIMVSSDEESLSSKNNENDSKACAVDIDDDIEIIGDCFSLIKCKSQESEKDFSTSHNFAKKEKVILKAKSAVKAKKKKFELYREIDFAPMDGKHVNFLGIDGIPETFVFDRKMEPHANNVGALFNEYDFAGNAVGIKRTSGQKVCSMGNAVKDSECQEIYSTFNSQMQTWFKYGFSQSKEARGTLDLLTKVLKPRHPVDFINNSHYIEKMMVWLEKWKKKNLNGKKFEKECRRNRRDADYTEEEGDSLENIADVKNPLLLCGPLGVGKSAAVQYATVFHEYNVITIGCNERRNSAHLLSKLSGALTNHAVKASAPTVTLQNFFQPKGSVAPVKPRKLGMSCIVIEDVDVLFDDDEGFWSTIRQMCDDAKVPIILTCTNKSNPSQELVRGAKGKERKNIISLEYLNPRGLSDYLYSSILGLKKVSLDKMWLMKQIVSKKGDVRAILNSIQCSMPNLSETIQIDELNTLECIPNELHRSKLELDFLVVQDSGRKLSYRFSRPDNCCGSNNNNHSILQGLNLNSSDHIIAPQNSTHAFKELTTTLLFSNIGQVFPKEEIPLYVIDYFCLIESDFRFEQRLLKRQTKQRHPITRMLEFIKDPTAYLISYLIGCCFEYKYV
uniref:AAA domain-containing protein n=1 Tax=Rhabditophanes sp. KR3021 TaxID=114890 RepID=A0AC35UEE7_9BILA